jgi:hypothetical protein
MKTQIDITRPVCGAWQIWLLKDVKRWSQKYKKVVFYVIGMFPGHFPLFVFEIIFKSFLTMYMCPSSYKMKSVGLLKQS